MAAPTVPTLDLPSPRRLVLQQLIAPRSIAVIGASANPGGHAGRCLVNLERTGFTGEIYPVNPKYPEIGGRTCYPDVTAIPGPVDTAYLLLPARAIPQALRQCVEAGVGTVVVCTSGFGENGADGLAAQQELAEIAGTGSTRVLGPNCIGVISPGENYVGSPTFNITYNYTPGSIAILSQSGGMGVVVFNRAQGRGIGIRSLVSLGNEADLRLGELVDAFVDDPGTSVIALFVEQLRDPAEFIAAAARARAASKPVVVLKTGSSAAGQRAAFGHTGALAGTHRVFTAVMAEIGVTVVDSVDALLDTCHLLSTTVRPAGRRLGVLAPSGGECSYVADLAEAAGLELPLPTAETVAGLKELMKFGNPGNPLDATGQIIGDGDLLDKVLDLFVGDPNFDMVALTIATWGPFDVAALFPRFVRAARSAGKPVVISAWTARQLTEQAETFLADSGVANFPSSDAAIGALARLADLTAEPATTRPATATSPAPLSLPRPDIAELSEFEAKQLLGSAGLPVGSEIFVRSVDEVAAAADRIGGPVVLKGLATGVVHKSDLGLVRLGLATGADAAAAAAEIAVTARAAGLNLLGFLVAELVSGIEVIVGGTRDETFGPVVLIGAGGILAETLPDVTVVRAPASASSVRRALTRLALWPVLDGARARSYDVDALVTAVVEFSRVFAGSDWMAEVDLNPVIVGRTDGGAAGGATIVDAAVSIAR